MILVYIAWSLRIFVNILSFAHLWWTKEYRFDRMLIHLRSTRPQSIVFPSFRRPPMTPKSVLLIFLSTIFLSFIILNYPLFYGFLIADVVTFPLMVVLVAMLIIPTRIYHTVIIEMARNKLKKHNNLLVIGITGSYGKTSVKEYLSTILAAKYRVLKTEASKNSPIGIAEVVMKRLRPDHEIFVVEMGAYKKGEIAEMARLVKPQIGIITAINPQHQDLFGSIENTVTAKYELIEGLTGKKIAIFNGDDTRVMQMAAWAKRDKVDVSYWSKKDAKNVRADFNGVEFIFKFNHIKTSVLGEHQVMNISLALSGAVSCGMSLKDAANAASNIKPAKGVMQKIIGANGSVFIDDTFNNNPDAAKAAILFLKKAKGRKILVFQPMIELGKYARTAHQEVGKLAQDVCDEIILTNGNFRDAFPSASVMDAKRAVQYLKKTIRKDDTVLFKGKEAGLVLTNL